VSMWGAECADAFASYAGVAPIEVSSGETHHPPAVAQRRPAAELSAASRGSDQVRMRTSAGRRFFDRKFAEGKTRNEAMRCLKRRLAAHVWRRMLADERALQHAREEPAIAA
jgi:transposase